ncbi:putative oxidoreductase protein [Eutypa lata UCREL1]|uniref:mRNA N(6)-methyladenine demethylase n=1 Tax=Eutypa lata (strain UCR-EL1) TaxID=1287681 RepID=M7T490_EUTLA|nr:putative oxidoreductase protein [Eutypa lata UCREL1]
MTIDLTTLDAHEQPSDELRDEAYDSKDNGSFKLAGHIPSDKLVESFKHLEGPNWQPDQEIQDVPIYFHPLLPGLLIMPSIIPPSIQKGLLSRMIHRDLSNPTHKTNLHLHYELPYRKVDDIESRSFFAYTPEDEPKFIPKDPAVHKPLSIKQVLQRKLSWVTLGGQYDWSNRQYPDQLPPEFPRDISGFLHTLFPDTLAQAAIVNFYSPGDTMMMHRDVSEHTDKGLASLSIGCEALFMVAPSKPSGGATEGAEGTTTDTEKPYVLLRLKSGDAIYMTKESRYAWHGVPKVLKDTCPDFLADWPAEDGKYEEWKGWMRNKRINLNVRQVND